MLCEWGYIALRIDFRGCGDSEGKRGYVLCLDQVADTRNCLEWLLNRTEVSPDRIGVMGHSFGAAVSVYTAGVDKRVAAVISTCGWGHGERKFRGQHPSENDWKKFTSIMAEGAAHKEKTGEALWVSRWDVVPVTKELRKYLPEDPQTKVSVDTVQSMFNFCAEDVVADIAPRPILFIHTANDHATRRAITAHVRTSGHASRALHHRRRISFSAGWNRRTCEPLSELARSLFPGRRPMMISIPKDLLSNFTEAVFENTGIDSHLAQQWGELLVWANLRGVDSHGVMRIPPDTLN